MVKNVLITGGAGFIGSHLSKKLLEKGYRVKVFDNLSPQIHGDDASTSPLFLSIKGKVEFVQGDVRVHEDWEKALVNQDAVIHLAAETGTGQSMYQAERYVDVNIRGTAILLDLLASKNYQIKKVLVASSRAIYGEGRYYCETHKEVYPLARNEADLSKGEFEPKCPICNLALTLQPTNEGSNIQPNSIYGFTKQSQEEMTLLACKNLGIPAIAFRYQNVYGPGQSLSNPYTGILSIFSTRILNGNTVYLFEDGKESRDFVYIDDVVDATILGLENQQLKNEVFNVGSGINTSVLEVAQKLKKAYDSSVDIKINRNFRLGDIRHNYADLAKISSIGFRPKVFFEEGVVKFTSWVKQQKVQPDTYEMSIQELKEKGLYK